MKSRSRLYRRAKTGVFYVHDGDTGKQESLGTRDRAEAKTLLASRNEAHRLPQLILDRGEQVFAWHYREDLETRLKSRPDIFRKVSG